MPNLSSATVKFNCETMLLNGEGEVNGKRVIAYAR